jgi:hypothetical protein
MKDWLAIRISWLDANMPGTATNCFAGVHEISNADPAAVLFPNPGTDKVYLEADGFNGKLTVSCCDQRGCQVMPPVVTENRRAIIDVNALANGIYIIEVKDEEGKYLYRKMTVSH